jgi:hypothetical protein
LTKSVPYTVEIAASGVRLEVTKEDGSIEPDTLLAKTPHLSSLRNCPLMAVSYSIHRRDGANSQ